MGGPGSGRKKGSGKGKTSSNDWPVGRRIGGGKNLITGRRPKSGGTGIGGLNSNRFGSGKKK